MTDDFFLAAGKDPRLQQRLILSRFFARRFGVDDFSALRRLVADQQEGLADEKRTYVSRVLEGLKGLDGISPEELLAFDDRIVSYVERLNANRPVRVRLKYFQYLAVLWSELYLDRLFNSPAQLLADLNAFIDDENGRLVGDTPPLPAFDAADLRKLSFWMATGSGKTLLLHVNYWQYLHYSGGLPADGTAMLITPEEGLSRQHLREFERSGIAGHRWGTTEDPGLLHSEDPINIIEVTKLVETKTGSGDSVEVASFGDKNVVFVDEGHRGATGDVWRSLRSALAEKGFTFEYSATLGQVVNGATKAKRPALLEEYGKSILVDYSYPHFHEDGYGKDYWVTNLQDDTDEFSERMVVANLLSAYQQTREFDSHRKLCMSYNLERPLWVFVGHTVVAGRPNSADRQSLSDVEAIVGFLADYLADRTRVEEAIEALLSETSGLTGADGRDIFAGHFKPLQRLGMTPADVYTDTIDRLFHGQPGQQVNAVAMRSAPGEIGLRLGDGRYFGVINIGDANRLMELLEGAGKISTSTDVITGSLFDQINGPESGLSLLIGSRKFMEGWDSFRVSSMGLMNIGRQEGSQIIQMFGRGVRLWGKDFSLKRSTAPDQPPAPAELRTVETLNVFGIRANYMAQFRDHLADEGVRVETADVVLPIKVEAAHLARDLRLLAVPDDADFPSQAAVVWRTEPELKVELDLRPKVERRVAGREDEGGKVEAEERADELRGLAPLLDKDQLMLDLLGFKEQKGLSNLVFTPAHLAEYLTAGSYSVTAVSTFLDGRRGYVRAHDAAVRLLRKYAAALYELHRRRFETERLGLVTLGAEDPNLTFEYVLRTSTEGDDRLEELRELVGNSDVYTKDTDVPTIVFDRHLYQPLVVADKTGRVVGVKPAALNEGEAGFVKAFRSYVAGAGEALAGKDIFLLRNLTRGRGLALFEPVVGEAFYPDFVIWVLEPQLERIAFVDPKGLRHARQGFNDPKLDLHVRLAALTNELRGKVSPDAELTSFIVSTTPYEDLAPVFGGRRYSKDEFQEQHVLFGEDPELVATLFTMMLDDASATADAAAAG